MPSTRREQPLQNLLGDSGSGVMAASLEQFKRRDFPSV
jgi:hypothetical protein